MQAAKTQAPFVQVSQAYFPSHPQKASREILLVNLYEDPQEENQL